LEEFPLMLFPPPLIARFYLRDALTRLAWGSYP
jgi:hypothetical protein